MSSHNSNFILWLWTTQIEEHDPVKAFPSTGKKSTGRFDTVIVLKDDGAESTGMEGL